MTTRLKILDVDYKTNHYGIIDMTDVDEALPTKQEAYDEHDDNVAQLDVYIHCQITKLLSQDNINTDVTLYGLHRNLLT